MTFEQQKEAFRQYYDSNFGFLNDAAKKFKEIIEVVIEDISTDSIQERVKKGMSVSRNLKTNMRQGLRTIRMIRYKTILPI